LLDCFSERSLIALTEPAQLADDNRLFERCEHRFYRGGPEQARGLPSPMVETARSWLVMAITTTSGFEEL
jgi:hypothetical protein